jgi:hypothetical protein
MRAFACAAFLVLAPSLLVAVLSACQPGGVTITVFIPDEVEVLVRDVRTAAVTAERVDHATDDEGREAPERRTASAGSLEELALRDLPPGRWRFRIDAYDHASRLLLQGATQGIDVARGEETVIVMVVARPESIVPLPVRWGRAEADVIARRSGLSLTVIPGHEEESDVLVAGGADGTAVATRDAWIYHPDQVRFAPIQPMRCPRSGHAAIRLDGGGGAVVLLAGGGSTPCEGGAGRTPANSMEIYDHATGLIRFYDPEWAYSPDLSSAQVVPLSGSRFFLLADGGAWILDIDHPEQVIETWDSERRMPGQQLRAVALDGERRVAVVGAQDDEVTVMVFDEGGLCGHSVLDQTVAEGFSVTALPSGRLLVISGGEWWVVITSECHVVSSELFRGTHSPARRSHTATALADQRILVVGGQEGDVEGQASVFLPESLTSTAQFMRPGSAARHRGSGHAVAALPDGTALIVGGDGGAEIYNPRRGTGEIVDAFDGRYRIEHDALTRVVFVVDSTDDGGRVRDALADTATNMLARPLGEEFVPAAGSAVGVLSSDRGVLRFQADDCEPGPREWGWDICATGDPPDRLPGVIPGEEQALEDTLRCRIEHTGAADGVERCPVRQHLAVVSGLMDQLEENEGGLEQDLGPDPGSLLIVLATAGEDCSEDPELAGSEIDFDPYGCHLAEGLIAPTVLAARILSFSRFRIEVVVLYGSPYEEFCGLTERFGQLVDALGDHGYAFSVCHADELDETSARVQNVARALAYRSVCLQPGAWSPAETCHVYASWQDNEVEWIVPRIPSTDWSHAADVASCIQPDGETWGALELTDACAGARDGQFQRFYYLCW